MDKPLVRITQDLSIAPSEVVSLAWERRHYMNCSGPSILIITTRDRVHRVEHTPHLLDGVDCYVIEKALING